MSDKSTAREGDEAMDDHPVIYLEPVCVGDERCWCQDGLDVCECGKEHPPTKYIRADLAASPSPSVLRSHASLQSEIERLKLQIQTLEGRIKLQETHIREQDGQYEELEANWRLGRAQLTKARADVIEVVGEPVDARFKPTLRDLDALRKDYKDHFDPEASDGLPVKVHVTPAVLYMTWPNEQYKPDDGSDPYRCISFHIPKPESRAHEGDGALSYQSNRKEGR